MTYDLAIKMMLLDHDYIDSGGLCKGEETESSRTVRLGIPHDGTVGNLAKLFEVGLHALCVYEEIGYE
jgi:hypothetical protein